MPDGRLGHGQLGDFVLGSTGAPAPPGGEFDLSAVIQKTMAHTRSLDAEIAGTNLPYLDDFTRSVDPGIGDSRYTADDETQAYVNGSELRVRTAGFGDASWVWSGAPRALATYSFDFYVPAQLNINTTFYEVDARKVRYNGATDWVSLAQVFQSDPADRWEYDVFGGDADIIGNFTPDRDEWYTIKWEVDPTVPQVRMKLWKRSDPEPGSWTATAAAAPYTNNWTPSIYISSDTPSAEARFDNLTADAWVPPPPQTSFTLDAVIASAPQFFDLDAVLFKRWEPPKYFETVPTVVGVATATGDEHTTDVAIPAVQAGDLLVAIVSLDQEGVTFGPTVSCLYDEALPGGSPRSWVVLHANTASTNHRLVSLYKFADKLDETASFKAYFSSSSLFVSARAVAIVAVRNAGTPKLFGSIGINTIASGAKSSNTGTPEFADTVNHGRSFLFLGAWAGQAATPTTWTPGTGVTEEVDVARADASLFVGSYPGVINQFFSGVSVTPSAAEIHLHHGIIVPPRTTSFGLSALIQTGGRFSLDAYLVAAYQQTRHPRTGPHFGMSPDTAITLSNPLGTLAAGATLQEALRELDDLISQRERGE